jgi:hypothetical protein
VCAGAANADPDCEKGKCVLLCRAGFAHCDGNPAGPCVALGVFYRDADGDGYGDTKQTKLACDAAALGAGWVGKAGDCHDGNPDVHPGQLAYFDKPYTSTAGSLSYDYDCNGAESEQAGTAHYRPCDTQCLGSGRLPAGSGRSGVGVNDYCGSIKEADCVSSGGPINTASVRFVRPAISKLPADCSTAIADVPVNPCR